MSTTPYAGPTAVRRQLGRRLARFRDEAGLSIDQVVADKRLGMSRSKLYRLEGGKHPVRPQDITALCRRYGVTETEIEASEGLALATTGQSWWHRYGGDAVPEWFSLYADLEPAADLIRGYEAELVPGLLQTEDYAWAIMRARNQSESESEITRRIKIRMERATILDRAEPAPPRLQLVLNEGVLLREVGGAEVMAAQREKLVAMTTRPNIDIHVLPMSVGAHASMETTFVILDFPNPNDDPSVVYIDSPSSAAYLHEASELGKYTFLLKDVLSRSIPIQEYMS